MDKNKLLVSLVIKYEGDYFKVLDALKKNEVIELECKNKYITILDQNYPSFLRDLKYPPLVLFYKGDIELLKHSSIAVVGSRIASDYALKATSLLCKHYKDEVIVSGLAKGIDACAHLNASKTIGVLGCGIDYIYPYENKNLYQKIINEGLIISEYPGFVKPLAYHFPFRNRIIVGLANTLYVMQSNANSGTITSVNEALELGKNVKVLPYDIFASEGINNNLLIKEGADMIEQEELTI